MRWRWCLVINDKLAGPFRLEVGRIRAYGALSLGSMRWRRRPRVVFARIDTMPMRRQEMREGDAR